MRVKFGRRSARFGAVPAFLATFAEFVLFLTFSRFVYRMVMLAVRFALRGGRAKVASPVVLKKV